ncbi:MAG: restriction endonuclease [Fluviicola sp.]|nr:MAG: restriction endonuclease [Fluviicola sp.]
MMIRRNHFIVYEHTSLKVDRTYDGTTFTQELYEKFAQFFGDGVPYFKLLRDGVRFNEYVGAIQIGDTLVEVLPKADKDNDSSDKAKWQSALVDMMRAVNGFDVKAPSESSLNLKNNSVLDLYFEMFIDEVEKLLHKGLAKKYRKTEGNLTALKGSLVFSKQISMNLVHKERFYTKYTTYDKEHLLHIILYKTIILLAQINTNSRLISRVNSLLLNFPEMPNQKITEATFEKLSYNRKTQEYKRAIDIARLLLMQYHPNLSGGNKDVLALMFDMNNLWEQFVLISLKKSKRFKVRGQNSTGFWKRTNGKTRSIRPDIKIEMEGKNFILDTKWKNVKKKPSIEDIRQMYAYHHYFEAEKVALVYPGDSSLINGTFSKIKGKSEGSTLQCGLMFISSNTNVKTWQEQIETDVLSWINNGEV